MSEELREGLEALWELARDGWNLPYMIKEYEKNGERIEEKWHVHSEGERKFYKAARALKGSRLCTKS